MADWTLPALTSNYTDVLNDLKNRDENSVQMLDGTTDTNLPVGAKRWNSTNARFEKWDGSAWAELVPLYNINVSQLGGKSVSYFLPASTYTASDVLTKIKTVDGSGSGLDADLLDGLHSTAFAKLNGDTTQTFKVANAVSANEAVSKAQHDLKADLAGSIIQVASISKIDNFSTSSTSFVDITGLSVTITPQYSTSKILIRANISVDNSSAGYRNDFVFVRDTTQIGTGTTGANTVKCTFFQDSYNSGSLSGRSASGEYVDSPNTTQSTTYKLQAKVNSGTLYINSSGGGTDNTTQASAISTITVMEVGA